jgi:hypothetical protein
MLNKSESKIVSYLLERAKHYERCAQVEGLPEEYRSAYASQARTVWTLADEITNNEHKRK